MSIADLKKNIEALAKSQVKVGWFEGNVYPNSGTPVAFVAWVNEHGGQRKLKNGRTVIIPARAPMRMTMDEQGVGIAKDLGGAVRRATADGDIAKWLEQFGLVTAARFKETINKGGRGPGNAQATIEGMVLGHNPDGSERRAGSSPAKENRKFGQGKGFDKPLVDTSQMMNTLIHKVETP